MLLQFRSSPKRRRKGFPCIGLHSGLDQRMGRFLHAQRALSREDGL